jgi:hypothetical protein
MALVSISINRHQYAEETDQPAPERRRWRRRATAVLSIVAVLCVAGGIAEATSGTISAPSSYTAITPTLLLSSTMATSTTKYVAVAGVDGVPADTTSVQLSITVTGGTAAGYLDAYPKGGALPPSANVHWLTGESVTIPVLTTVGTGGDVAIRPVTGTVTVKVTLVGYYEALPAPAVGETGPQGAAENDFDSPGAATYTVPAGVHELQIEAWGGGGGAAFEDLGGQGGFVAADVYVTPGDTITMSVGDAGDGGADAYGTITNGGATTVTTASGITVTAPGGACGIYQVGVGAGGPAGTVTGSTGAGAVTNVQSQAGATAPSEQSDPAAGQGLPGSGGDLAGGAGNGLVIVTDL